MFSESLKLLIVYSSIGQCTCFQFFNVLFGEGLDMADVSEVDGDGFELIENVFFDGCLEI
jgi:hypothetical protein